MTEPWKSDQDDLKMRPLELSNGLLEQLNLPPKITRFLRRNQAMVWTIVLLVMAAALGTAGFTSYHDHHSKKAVAALDNALIAPAATRQELLTKVAEQYGASDSGRWARVELAMLQQQDGKVDKAIEQLEKVNSELSAKSLLKPLVVNKLAVMFENSHRLDKALALYVELSKWPAFAPEAYRAQGRINEQLGHKQDAIAMYTKFLEVVSAQTTPGQSNPLVEMVQLRLKQLKK